MPKTRLISPGSIPNHKLLKNLQLQGNYISNDGGNEGITIANSGSAAGDLDSLEPGSNNTFAAGEKIEVETDGGSTNAIQVDLTLVFDIT